MTDEEKKAWDEVVVGCNEGGIYYYSDFPGDHADAILAVSAELKRLEGILFKVRKEAEESLIDGYLSARGLLKILDEEGIKP